MFRSYYDSYGIMHMSTFLLQNGALWDMRQVHCGICDMGLYAFDMASMWHCTEHKQAIHCDPLNLQWDLHFSIVKTLAIALN